MYPVQYSMVIWPKFSLIASQQRIFSDLKRKKGCIYPNNFANLLFRCQYTRFCICGLVFEILVHFFCPPLFLYFRLSISLPFGHISRVSYARESYILYESNRTVHPLNSIAYKNSQKGNPAGQHMHFRAYCWPPLFYIQMDRRRRQD